MIFLLNLVTYKKIGELLAHQVKHMVYSKRVEDMVYFGYIDEEEASLITNHFLYLEYFLIEHTIAHEFYEHPNKRKRIIDTFYRELKQFYQEHFPELNVLVENWDRYLGDVHRKNEILKEALYLTQHNGHLSLADFFFDSLILDIPRFRTLSSEERNVLIKYFHYFITQYMTLILYILIDHKAGSTYETNKVFYEGSHPKFKDLGNELGDILCLLSIDYSEHQKEKWEKVGFDEGIRATVFLECLAGYMLFPLCEIFDRVQEQDDSFVVMDSFKETCFQFVESRIQAPNPIALLQTMNSIYNSEFLKVEDEIMEEEHNYQEDVFEYIERRVIENVDQKLSIILGEPLTDEQKSLLEETLEWLSNEVEERTMISFITFLQSDVKSTDHM